MNHTHRRFISSCSLKDDDLTQWRLYADDSKGVCLVFNVNQPHPKSKFIIKKISYGRKDGTHPELELIKNIASVLKTEYKIDFEFKTLSTWRHFFKPADYDVEEEVRILYVLTNDNAKKGWLLTNSHNILNPYVEFKLSDKELPIQLSRIVLGPKCSEKHINKKQFEQLIRELRKRKIITVINGEKAEIPEYNIPKLTVPISRINNYR